VKQHSITNSTNSDMLAGNFTTHYITGQCRV